MYSFGEKSLNGECLSLKESADFDLREGSCEKDKSFICQWTSPSCPNGYEYVGQLSDGSTCHAILDSNEGDFESASCGSNQDLLRKRFAPANPSAMERFTAQFV